ncbi:MAG: NINE protein [Planctomycetota bacterium]|nr:NINE protein [Planctomycetota bacterium]
MIRVQCPRCQTRFTTSDANAGKTGQCPKCGNPIKVSAAGSPAAPPSGSAAAGGTSAPAAASHAAGASAGASSDSALGEARRHAAQASAAGAARPAATSARPAPRPETQRPSKPSAEAKPAPAAAAAEAAEAESAAGPQGKSKTVALVLCIFLGALGTHRFYMGAWGWGLVIFGLNLTCIGGVVFAIIDAIKLVVMDRTDFQERYAETVVRPFTF